MRIFSRIFADFSSKVYGFYQISFREKFHNFRSLSFRSLSRQEFVSSGVCLSGVCLSEFVIPEFVIPEFVIQEFVMAPIVQLPGSWNDVILLVWRTSTWRKHVYPESLYLGKNMNLMNTNLKLKFQTKNVTIIHIFIIIITLRVNFIQAQI